MSNQVDTALETIKTSLAAKLSARVVTRSLVDPAAAKAADLKAGLLCLVAKGGGEFANYRGREGDLAHVQATLVGFVKVDDKGTTPLSVEQAELALLQDVLDWVKEPGAIKPVNTVLPLDWQQSSQLEHPYGWFALRLDVRT